MDQRILDLMSTDQKQKLDQMIAASRTYSEEFVKPLKCSLQKTDSDIEEAFALAVANFERFGNIAALLDPKLPLSIIVSVAAILLVDRAEAELRESKSERMDDS